MASITRISDRSFRIRVSEGFDEKGKRKYLTETFYPSARTPKAQEKEARRYSEDLERRIRSGRDYDSGQLTFREYTETFWKPRKIGTIEQTMLEGYISTLKRTVYPAVGHLRLNQINILHIQKIYDELTAAGKAPATIRQVHAVISDIFKFAYKMNIVAENPCGRAVLPKMKPAHEIRFFTDEQTLNFLEALTNGFDIQYPERIRKNGRILPAYSRHINVSFQWITYFNLAVYGGFRRGELVGLTWADIDFDQRTIFINKARARTQAGDITKMPKSTHGIRAIILPESCFKLLRQWKREQLIIAFKLGYRWKGYYRKNEYDKNNVFIDLQSGVPMNVSTPTHKFKEVLSMYNKTHPADEQLPDIRLHDLRHTSATLLLANNVDIETVSHRLGHSKASTTLDIYGHAMKKMDSKASDTLESILSTAKQA
ncbi:MAG: site-specific integrase [Lachnospiraceae bacterium]|nr:site-specific integrase [Lachnospiraceae bacterium]